jgi:hypothetical protein
MRPLAAAVALLALSSCMTTNVQMTMGDTATTITTSPNGARVFINGVEVCSATPCNWSEGDGLSQRYHLQVRKEGYQEIDFYLDKELRFFGNGSFNVIGWRLPRQISLAMQPPPGAAPPSEGTAAQQTPGL